MARSRGVEFSTPALACIRGGATDQGTAAAAPSATHARVVSATVVLRDAPRVTLAARGHVVFTAFSRATTAAARSAAARSAAARSAAARSAAASTELHIIGTTVAQQLTVGLTGAFGAQWGCIALVLATVVAATGVAIGNRFVFAQPAYATVLRACVLVITLAVVATAQAVVAKVALAIETFILCALVAVGAFSVRFAAALDLRVGAFAGSTAAG